jgi:hypothetical protein
MRRAPPATASTSAAASSRSDPPQFLLERAGEVAQRSAALVAVQPRVAAPLVLACGSALPRSRDAHHEDDLAVPARASRGGAAQAEGALDLSALGLVERERRGARRRARGLRTAGARDRHDRR